MKINLFLAQIMGKGGGGGGGAGGGLFLSQVVRGARSSDPPQLLDPPSLLCGYILIIGTVYL